MTEADLSGYKVQLTRNPIFGTWTFSIGTPDGHTLYPLLSMGWISKDAAEVAAVKRIDLHRSRETIDGETLKQRVEARTA